MAYMENWTYEHGICRMFVYGGCGGNGNRFPSKEECEQTCFDLPMVMGPTLGFQGANRNG